jgi:hypothetical protein
MKFDIQAKIIPKTLMITKFCLISLSQKEKSTISVEDQTRDATNLSYTKALPQPADKQNFHSPHRHLDAA